MSSSPAAAEKEEDEVHLLEDSGLTDAKRRDVRRQQRELYKDLEEKETLKVEEARGRNNEIYKHVRYTREAVLDGENLTLIANKAAQQVDRMIQVPRYDADRLVSKLGQKCRNGRDFDWRSLGMEAGICFNAIPSGVCFLNGPLMDGQTIEVRQRAPRQKFVEEEEGVEEKPENVQGHTNRDADQLSAIEQSLKVLQHTLKKKVDEQYLNNKKRLSEAHDGDIPPKSIKRVKRHGVEICAVNYMFNPKSFTQTVENLFHYSFLVKKGTGSISVRNKVFSQDGLSLGQPGPVVKYVNDGKENPPARQTIVSLTMRDWRKMCQSYKVEGKCDVPHRTGSKQQTKRDRHTQSQMSQSSR